LAANQQEFNQNQISGFEDPFSLLQLQSQIEMEREQMNMQEKMQEKQMKAQMGMQGAQMGMGLLGGGGGKEWNSVAGWGAWGGAWAPWAGVSAEACRWAAAGAWATWPWGWATSLRPALATGSRRAGHARRYQPDGAGGRPWSGRHGAGRGRRER